MTQKTRLIISALATMGTWTQVDLLFALMLGVGAYVVTEPKGSNKALFVMDLETGQMKGQPDDAITQEYLRKRGDNE